MAFASFPASRFLALDYLDNRLEKVTRNQPFPFQTVLVMAFITAIPNILEWALGFLLSSEVGTVIPLHVLEL